MKEKFEESQKAMEKAAQGYKVVETREERRVIRRIQR